MRTRASYPTLQNVTLTDDQRAVVCMSINRFSTGAHPYADTHNLPYFTRDAAIKSLNKAMSHLNEAGQIVANAAIAAINVAPAE